MNTSAILYLVILHCALWHLPLGPGLMWGVDAYERDRNAASSVTITSLFMLVFIIFIGQLGKDLKKTVNYPHFVDKGGGSLNVDKRWGSPHED